MGKKSQILAIFSSCLARFLALNNCRMQKKFFLEKVPAYISPAAEKRVQRKNACMSRRLDNKNTIFEIFIIENIWQKLAIPSRFYEAKYCCFVAIFRPCLARFLAFNNCRSQKKFFFARDQAYISPAA